MTGGLWLPSSASSSSSSRSAAAACVAIAAATYVASATLAKRIDAAPLKLEEVDILRPWQARWDVQQTGWHLDNVNPFLERFLHEVLPPEPALAAPGLGRRIVVPLCGKTVDMAFLARKGFRVVGIEGISQAIDEFAQEHGVPLPHGGKSMVVQLPDGLNPQQYRAKAVLISAGDVEATRTEAAPPVLLVQGDFLQLGPSEVEALVPFDAAFDRGGLVAVEPAERQRYANVLKKLVKPGGRLLQVVAEHEPFKGGKLGPPFSIAEAEIHELFGNSFEIRKLCREDTIDRPPGGMRERGLSHFYENIYLLTKKPEDS